MSRYASDNEELEVSDDGLKRVNGACPFCNSAIRSDEREIVYYTCGSWASRLTGMHSSNCFNKNKGNSGIPHF